MLIKLLGTKMTQTVKTEISWKIGRDESLSTEQRATFRYWILPREPGKLSKPATLLGEKKKC